MKRRRISWALGWLASVCIAFLIGRTGAPPDTGGASSAEKPGEQADSTSQESADQSGARSNASTAPRPAALPRAKRRLEGGKNEPSPQAPGSRTQGQADDEKPITFSENTNVNSLSQRIAEKLRKFLGDRGEVLSVDCAEYPCIAYLSTTDSASGNGLGNEFMGQMMQALADVGFSRSMIELSQRGDGTLAVSMETDDSKPLDSDDVKKRVSKRVSEYFDEFAR